MVWAKGQSGNPQGRKPSEQTFAPLLRRLLAEKTDGCTRAERVCNTLLGLCEAGDVNAIKTVFERIDGKVTEPIDLTSGGETFSFVVQSRKADDEQ